MFLVGVYDNKQHPVNVFSLLFGVLIFGMAETQTPL